MTRGKQILHSTQNDRKRRAHNDKYKMKEKVVAIYPGSFDPVTYGHLDLISRSISLCDILIVAVANNPSKKTLFTSEERVSFLKETTREIPRVEIETFNDLLVEYVREKGARIIIRGLRAFSDFEYEFQMVLTNRKIAPDIETMFLMPREEYFSFSSHLIKELAYYKADLTHFVPSVVARALMNKLKSQIPNPKSQK